MPLDKKKPERELHKVEKRFQETKKPEYLKLSGNSQGSGDTKKVEGPATAETFVEGFKDFLNNKGFLVNASQQTLDRGKSETGPEPVVPEDSRTSQIAFTSFHELLGPPPTIESDKSSIASSKSNLSDGLKPMLSSNIDVNSSHISIDSLDQTDNRLQQHLQGDTLSLRSIDGSDQQPPFYSQENKSSDQLSEISSDSDISVYSHWQTDEGTLIPVRHPARQYTMSRDFLLQKLGEMGIEKEDIEKGTYEIIEDGTNRFDCGGHVFLKKEDENGKDQRGCLDPSIKLETLLKNNGYSQIDNRSRAKPGDLIVYDEGSIHIGFVYNNDGEDVRVESKWGELGVLRHPIDIPHYGPGKVFRSSRLGGRFLDKFNAPESEEK